MTKRIVSLLSLCLGIALAVPAFGQATLTQTTLASALSQSGRYLQVASATGITANNTVLFIKDAHATGEAVFVNSVNGTTVGVTRGYNGAGLTLPHAAGALVFVGPPNYFFNVDPSGSCTPANTIATPYINVFSGREWLCSSITGLWVPGFFNTAAPAGVTTAVASATTITPSGPLFHVTGSTAITTIGSAVGMGGSTTSTVGAPFCIIPDNATANGLTAGNNIAKSTTFVVNQPVCLTFDQTNNKYVASY